MYYLSRILILIFTLTLTGSGCSYLQSLPTIDQSQLNHRAMLLDDRLLPTQKTFLTNLKSIEDSSGGGGCSVCAY
ncbi:MAG: hypothetical protein HQK49_08015 [Oligoflexia bacterium]|nr:hypothetical protein [Oligoflexia bacterium]